jgi:hypothetical protein
MNNNISLITGLVLFAATGLSQAQVLEMPMEAEPTELQDATTQPMDAPSNMEPAPTTLPGRGMSMEQVAERFGNPGEKIERVGEPPISRWVYGSFTVYFEYDKVIHSVTHK